MKMKSIMVILLVLTCPGLLVPASAYICNNAQFFEECPTADPIFATIVNDFKIRRDGVLINPTALTCTPPISSMPINAYTDELVLLQALRAIYYMDLGRSNYLPWTPKTLYGWLKENLGGFEISTTPGEYDHWAGQMYLSSGDTANYFVIRAKDDSTREYQRKWAGPAGISTMISLMMHERRHGDGSAFNHVRCCTAQDPANPNNACDQTYEETSNLSPYGIQYWLEKSWVSGYIDVGVGCMNATEKADAINWMRQDANVHAIPTSSNFCTNTPPVLTDANNPTGGCTMCTGGSSTGDTHLATSNGLFYDFQASGDFVLLQADPNFVVQTRQVSGAPTWPNATVNKAVATQMGNDKVALCLAPTRLNVDGQNTNLEDGKSVSTPGGIEVWRKGNVYYFLGKSGDSVSATDNGSYIDVSVAVGHRPAKLSGLLANPNGNVNQIATRDGTVLTSAFSFDDLYHRYADSWRVSPRESLLSVCGDGKVES
ncbi:MAG TPA: hypothetical protein VKB86_20610, partial [Pyrinomonadaceae bacterium]|nr:hypothetical protein [Pyrinomonadaceae bacterium]